MKVGRLLVASIRDARAACLVVASIRDAKASCHPFGMKVGYLVVASTRDAKAACNPGNVGPPWSRSGSCIKS